MYYNPATASVVGVAGMVGPIVEIVVVRNNVVLWWW
jgi:hypothetical protein